MAVKTEKVYNTFVKGLITEASALTFPENASIEESNFVLNRDGSRSRRLGVDYEDLYGLTDTGYTTSELATGKQSFHKWESPGGDTTISIGVIRIINKFWFINLLHPNPSANLLNGGNPITLPELDKAEIETAVINNKLVVVSENLPTPSVMTYDVDAQTISEKRISIYVRDLWGVYDGFSIDTRPETNTNPHQYNLRNQGWSESVVTRDGAHPDCIDFTKHTLGVYPSNSDVWTLGKISNPSSEVYETYDPDVLEKNSTSKFQVAKGSYIIDAFNRGTDRIGLSDVNSGLPNDQETGSFSTIASYAQRLFYSGVASQVNDGDAKSPNYSGYIFFTKTITSEDDFGICHQVADPTDPSISDLIASDGGTIQIPEASKIVKIVSAQSSLLVFAENGVWEIYGDTGGFIATSFQASKISTNGITNANSVINVNGNFIYWSKAGIYTVTTDDGLGRFKAQSISLTTIQTLFLNIPDIGKNHCKGFYDEKENRCRWLYNDEPAYNTDNYINGYSKELVYDLTLDAWYVNDIGLTGTSLPQLVDYIDVPGYAVSDSDTAVVSNSDGAVLDASSEVVVVTENLLVNRSSVFSFLTLVGTSFTVSKYLNTDFVDWYSHDSVGVDFESYLITGYDIMGDVMRDKDTPYVFFYFKKTENGFVAIDGDLIPNNESSCKVQAQWNWSDSSAGGKWGREFQAYRMPRFYTPVDDTDNYDTGDTVIVTRNKVRGSGKSLSFKIRSESGKDMHLLGLAYSANGTSSI